MSQDIYTDVYSFGSYGRLYGDLSSPGTTPEVVERTNLVVDPRPEMSQTWTGWKLPAASSLPISVDTDIVYNLEGGPASRRLTSDVSGGLLYITQDAANRSVLPAVNTPFQVRVAVFHSPVAETLVNRNIQVNILQYDAGGSLIATTPGVGVASVSAGDWKILDGVITPVINTTAVAIQVQFQGSDIGDQYFVCEPLLVAAPVGQPFTPVTKFFDGDTAIDGNFWHRWTGTRGLSTSQRYRPSQELPGRYGRIYFQPSASERPNAATLVNQGNRTSQRIKMYLYGPLPQEDWEVVNETTGDSFFIDFNLVDEALPLVVDSFTRSVSYGGNDVSSLFYGEWIYLAPGANTLRLRTGASSGAAYMVVEAYSSWR